MTDGLTSGDFALSNLALGLGQVSLAQPPVTSDLVCISIAVGVLLPVLGWRARPLRTLLLLLEGGAGGRGREPGGLRGRWRGRAAEGPG